MSFYMSSRVTYRQNKAPLGAHCQGSGQGDQDDDDPQATAIGRTFADVGIGAVGQPYAILWPDAM